MVPLLLLICSTKNPYDFLPKLEYTVKLCKMQSNIGHIDDIAHWNFAITFEFIVHGILINTIGLIGLIGNIVAIGVLSRPQMKSSITTILIGLVR